MWTSALNIGRFDGFAAFCLGIDLNGMAALRYPTQHNAYGTRCMPYAVGYNNMPGVQKLVKLFAYPGTGTGYRPGSESES